MASLSVKYDSDIHESEKQKCKKQSRGKNSKKLSMKWKGTRKMTIVFAAFMVSMGIPRWCVADIKIKDKNALKIRRNAFGFKSQPAFVSGLL